MSTSAIGTVLDAIRAGLILRSGLDGVNVYTADIPIEEAGQECIAFNDCRLTQMLLAMGGKQDETWEVDADIRVVKPWAGGTELTIKAARDRLLAIWAEVETYLNDTYTGGLPDVNIVSGEIQHDYSPEGRICHLPFTITVKASKNP